MENREIIVENQVISYSLTFKNTKRCYLRIVSGKVVVTAGRGFTISDIEKFILANKKIVLDKVNNYVSKNEYIDNGYVTIFNRRYQIKIIDRKRKKCELIDDVLYVYHQDVQTTIEKYLKNILLEYVHKVVNEFLITDFSFEKPELIIKKVKSRWGACYYKKNKISFNLALIHLDYELIDYVIMHELCHFLQHNHSTYFYQELAKRMPDYKQREKRLKEETI